MASAYSDSDSENDELNCSICFYVFDEPRILNCGHSFCSKCLEQLIERNQRQCPDCRCQFPETSRCAQDFPQNYSLKKAALNKKGGREQRESAIRDLCSTHHKPKAFFCKGVNCSQLICEDCWSTNHIGVSQHEVVLKSAAIVSNVRGIAAKNTDKIIKYQETVENVQEKTKTFSSSMTEFVQMVNEMTNFHLDFVSNAADCNLENYSSCMLEKRQNQQDHLQSIMEELESINGLLGSVYQTLQVATEGETNFSSTTEDKHLTNPRTSTSTRKYKTKNLVSMEVIKRLPMDCLDEIVTLQEHVYDYHSNRVIFSFEKWIYIFDHNLDFIEKLTVSGGLLFQRTIESVAIGWSDTIMYVLQKTKGQLYIVSAVSKATGKVYRIIQQSEKSELTDSKIVAMDNRLFVLEKLAITKNNKIDTIQIKHFENEVFVKLIHTNATDINKLTITPEYILDFSEENKIVIQRIENSDLLKRRIALAEVTAIKKVLFIPDSDNPVSTSGYLFVTHLVHNLYHYLKVFHVNLATVENFEVLQPINFDFIEQRDAKQTNFLLAIGHDQILCRGQFNDGMRVLKLKFA